MARHAPPLRPRLLEASRHEYVIQGQDANSFVYYSIIRSARVGFNFMAAGHEPGATACAIVWSPTTTRYYRNYAINYNIATDCTNLQAASELPESCFNLRQD